MKLAALSIIFLFLIAIETRAQFSIVYSFDSTQDSLLFHTTIQAAKTVQDSLKGVEILRGYLQELRKRAYLEASFDSLSVKDSFFNVKCHIGSRYQGAIIRNGNVPAVFLSAIGFNEKQKKNTLFSIDDMAAMEEKLLQQAENSGYPLAQVWLDSVVIGNGQISAALMLQTGSLFTFDTLKIEGFAHIKPSFLHQYLDIKKGAVFNRSKILDVSSRLAELTFLLARQKPTVTFKENNTASVNLLLDTKKASQWDFLVGILPNTNVDGSQKFTITFNGHADFHNILGMGERFFANFENLRPQSPRLNLKTTLPYLLNTPFGFDGAFDLYKRDSLYLESHLTLGTQYFLGNNNNLKLFWNRYKANNLIINKLQVISSKKLPSTLDVSSQNFGLEWSQSRLDYRFNPRKGYTFLLRGSAGIRQVRKNLDIVSLKDPNDALFNFTKLYDTLDLTSFQYKIETHYHFYVPVFKRSTVKIGLQTAWLFTSSPISLNEQYRIGGHQLLRGFNEESIFATQYAIGTLEYRLHIGLNSYLYAFTDMGFVADVSHLTKRFDTPLGFGAGITFETKVGLFGFTLAAGRENGNPIDLKNTKTHFGYISLF
jgi:outer membrane protein assembly factor BamA